MALGRQGERQTDLMVGWAELPRSPGHAFYDRLQAVLIEAGFDGFAETQCAPYYASRRGRPSLPPGRYFRMHLVGCFEGIDSERGLEWRCSDSLSLREFLRLETTELVPEHSWLSKTRARLPLEVHEAVFGWVLERLAEHGLIKGERIGIDASTMEANAALRAIVRRDSGEGYREMLKRLAVESGGMRRAWLRGRGNLHKRYLVHVAGCDLGLIMRLLVGAGTPRGSLAGASAYLLTLATANGAIFVVLHHRRPRRGRDARRQLRARARQLKPGLVNALLPVTSLPLKPRAGLGRLSRLVRGWPASLAAKRLRTVATSRHQQAARYVADLAGDEARLIRGEIKDKICDFVRSTQTAHRRLIDPALVRVLADSLHHGCFDAPRPDRVHPNIVGSELTRHVSCEADQRRFRRRIMDADDVHVGTSGDRRHVHDGTCSGRTHGGTEQTHGVETTRQVDTDDAVPLVRRHLPYGMGAPFMLRGNAGVVY